MFKGSSLGGIYQVFPIGGMTFGVFNDVLIQNDVLLEK